MQNNRTINFQKNDSHKSTTKSKSKSKNKPRVRRVPILEKLPKVLVEHILGFCTIRSVGRFAQTNKKAKEIAYSQQLWKRLSIKHKMLDPSDDLLIRTVFNWREFAMEGDFKWDLQSVDKKELHEFELFGKAGVGLKEGKNKYEYSRGCISNHRSLNLRYIYHIEMRYMCTLPGQNAVGIVGSSREETCRINYSSKARGVSLEGYRGYGNEENNNSFVDNWKTTNKGVIALLIDMKDKMLYIQQKGQTKFEKFGFKKMKNVLFGVNMGHAGDSCEVLVFRRISSSLRDKILEETN